MFKKNAFTLAEVLITLAIIGVVAAMTIPILMQNYQKGQYVTALKKVYSQISNAIDRVMLDSNAENFNDVTLLHGVDADFKTFFKTYFRVSKYCDSANLKSCFTTDAMSITKNANDITTSASVKYCVIVKDGASICIANLDPDNTYIDYFVVDTNGLDKPNIGGRDIFSFSVYYDGSIDEMYPEARNAGDNQGKIDNCVDSSYGGGCFSKIFDAGWKMDY